MRTYRIIILALIVLGLALPSAQAQGRVAVWSALDPDTSGAVANSVNSFGELTGAVVELQLVEEQALFDIVAKAAGSGQGPDLILAEQQAAGPLVEGGLIVPVSDRQSQSFLNDLLNGADDVIAARCGDQNPQECVWGTSSSLPVMMPGRATAETTMDWICSAADWMSDCRGSSLTGLPVAWGFSIYLMNTQWLAEQGLEPPTTSQGVDEVRSSYGLDFAEAEPGFLPAAGDVPGDAIYVVDSSLLTQDAQGVLQSVASFFEAGYTPVLNLEIDSAYVSSSSADVDLAQQAGRFMAEDSTLKLALFDGVRRLPTFSPNLLIEHGIDSDATRVTLQALSLLTTFAALAY